MFNIQMVFHLIQTFKSSHSFHGFLENKLKLNLIVILWAYLPSHNNNHNHLHKHISTLLSFPHP